MVKLEAGKYYRTRDGRKVGPLTDAAGPTWPWKTKDSKYWYEASGFSCPGSRSLHSDADDIVAEWQDEIPVRTVTRREIVPGSFGRNMHVGKPENGTVHVAIGGLGMALAAPMYTADELEAAALVLQQLAEALRDGP